MGAFGILGTAWALALAVAGCAATGAEEFRRAQSAGTDAAWRQFLARHPASARADEARRALDDAVYETVLREGGADAYEAYMEEHPEGAHIRAALLALDDLVWEQASEAERPDAYLERHPRGRHADEARGRLDRELLDAATGAGSRGLREFLRDRPDSAYRADAWAALEKALADEAADGGLILWRIEEGGRQVGLDAVVGWSGGRALRLSSPDLGEAVAAGLAPGVDGRATLHARVFARLVDDPPPNRLRTAVMLVRVGDDHRLLTAPVKLKRNKRAQNLKLDFEGALAGLEGQGRAYVMIVDGPEVPAGRADLRPVSNIESVSLRLAPRLEAPDDGGP